MMRTLRWVLALPAGFLASLFAGFAGTWIGNFIGSSSWYTWVISGGLSAMAFFGAAYRVAPAREKRLTWILVGIVGLFGAVSALGALMASTDRFSALAGLTMIVVASYEAKDSLKVPGVEEGSRSALQSDAL
jgi:uncharacterized membrane protein YfcA